MSDMDTELTPAEKYLERLQIEALRRRGIDPAKMAERYKIDKQNILDVYKLIEENSDPAAFKDYKKQYMTEENINEMLKSYNIKRPTRYENPDFHIILMILSKEIEDVIKILGWESVRNKPHHFIFGTIPLGQINAMCIKNSALDEYLIVFENDLFIFSSLISKIIASCISYTEMNNKSIRYFVNMTDLKNKLNNKAFLFRFNQLMKAYLLNGTPSAAPPYVIPKEQLQLSAWMSDSLKLFVLGHEYAHILLGDLNTDKNMIAPILMDREKINIVVRSLEKELIADSFGLLLMINAVKQRFKALDVQTKALEVPFYFCGPELFFGAMDILEKAKSLIMTGNETTFQNSRLTHPSPLLRRKKIREFNNTLNWHHVNYLGSTIEEIFDILWLSIRDGLYKLYLNGIKLDRKWLYTHEI